VSAELAPQIGERVPKGSKRPDRTTRRQLFGLAPRLLTVDQAGAYLAVGGATIRDYVAAGILEPVELPGSTLREPGGRIIAQPGARRLAKIPSTSATSTCSLTA
jgi:hypothetical protein